MKLIKSIVALAVFAAASVSAATVTYNIPDAGQIVWTDNTLKIIDLQKDVVDYTLDSVVNDMTLVDGGDLNDIMIFHKNNEPARQLILTHDKSKGMTIIMPLLHGKQLGQWIVDDRYTNFTK